MVNSNFRIISALVVGIFLVVGAFVISKKADHSDTNGQLAVVQNQAERQYLSVDDKDNDGIPDWQNALLKTEEIVIASSTDWKPNTLTDKFSVAFFESIIRNKTYGPLGTDNDTIIAGATDVLAGYANDTILAEGDIVIVPQSDTATLRNYGNTLADIILEHPMKPPTEMTILQNSLRDNNPAGLKAIDPILIAYQTMVLDMKQTPVPEPFVFEHLDLLNAYNAVANDIAAMRNVYEDPALGMLRVKRYEDDVLGMGQAMVNVFKKLVTEYSVTFQPSDSARILIQ
ncbi:hypothetical protein KC845_00055 [Candidatus Kaiserbacteria bacterium]|nr:hypothetical protein [Candidatus Kaiserbacteria bacterium]